MSWAGFMNLQGDFCSSSEDLLAPPWDPVVEALLQEEPTSVPLPTICGTDCAFWLRLNGEPIQTLGEYKGHRVMAPVLLDKKLPALYVPHSGWLFGAEKRMDVYGNQQLCGTLHQGNGGMG